MQLAKLCNVLETPFGGINMIFAGDFAQLAPVKSVPLYSSLVGTTVDASMTVIGQKTQSKDDAKLRKASENM